MVKKRIKYNILGFLFFVVGIILANIYLSLSIDKYILLYPALMLLMLAPFFIFKTKPSRYLILSIFISSTAYVLGIILFVIRVKLPDFVEEIGVAFFVILIFLTLIFFIMATAMLLKELIRFFNNGD